MAFPHARDAILVRSRRCKIASEAPARARGPWVQTELLPVDEVTPEFERIIPRGTSMDLVAADNSFAEGPMWNARDRYLL